MQKKTVSTVENSHDQVAELNSRIMEVTMKIKEKYPELTKYIEELPVTIPNEENPKVNLQSLQKYYETLNSILNKYIMEHHDKI